MDGPATGYFTLLRRGDARNGVCLRTDSKVGSDN